MRTMKDSGIEWIGQIPQEWDVRKIKHCFNVYAGATPKSGNSEFWDGDIVWVTPADYTTEQKYVSEGRKSITSEGFESCSTEMIPAGSLIFSKRAPIGLVAINTVDLCTNQGCLSCVPLDKNDVEYFYYAFSSFTEQFDLYGSGTTFKEISADAFVNFPIPCPTIETQRNISEYLRNRCAEIDALIAAKEKTNALLKERRQSIIYEAVTKGLNPDAPMKDSGIEWIGQIPEHWEVRRLKVIADMQTGTTPKTSDVEYFDGDVNWFTPADFSGDMLITESERKLAPKAIEEGQAHFFPQNTIMLVGIGATVGKTAFTQVDASCNQQVTAIMVRELERAKYYAYWLSACSAVIKATASYTTLPIINNQHLGETPCPYVDDIGEQTGIIKYLDDTCSTIDGLISANEETIKKLKEYRQSVIYEAVTGKIEV